MAIAHARLATGERRDLVLAGNTVTGQSPAERVGEFLAVTRAFWQEWIGLLPLRRAACRRRQAQRPGAEER